MQSIFKQQAAAKQNAQRGNFLDFCCAGDGTDFDEEVMTDTSFLGLVRNEYGMLELHAEFVFDKALNERSADDSENMGTWWWL
jgi:hypothetical protein